MRSFGEIIVIAVVASIISIATGGCAALQGASETIDAGAVINAAAAGASGDYAKALSEIAKMVAKKKAKNDPLAGYQFSRTYFYDGAPVSDPSRITWTDKWEKSDSAGKTPVPTVVSTNTASSTAPATDAEADAWADAIADILIDNGIVEK